MDTATPIRILLADDHLVVRMGLSAIISRHAKFQLVGEADCGEDAVRLAEELSPDVVVMDLKMPTMDGATATARILERLPGVRVLILTSFADAADLGRARAAGASGALLKTSRKEEILSAIEAVASGRSVFSPELEQIFDSAPEQSALSPRQTEILRLVAKGFSNKEIARILGIGAESVKQHLKTAFQRLGVSSRAEAVARVLPSC